MQPARPAGQAGLPVGAVPFAMVQDINQLSQLSGIPVQTLSSNPAMQMAAQQMVAQRIMQQQILAQGGQVRPGAMLQPAQMLALQQAQQAQLQQRLAAAGGAAPASGAGKRGGGRKRGRPPAATSTAAAAAFAAIPAHPAGGFADPGGKLVWAKVGSTPWWPAKLLDPQRDPSYPPDADPPRPTSIPIRFFGSYEFQWIGSKRQLTEWDDGFEQFSEESDQSSFKSAIQEAQLYKATGKLPDIFYITPEPDKPKSKARGKKRARAADGPDGAAPAAGAGAAGGAGGKARGAARAAEAQEDRALVVQRRRKQRLQELGLLPPDSSPYVGGHVAPNPHLFKYEEQWRQQYAHVIEEQRQQEAALAERKEAAAAAAKERADAEAAARQQAAATAAAVAAATQPVAAGALQQQGGAGTMQPAVLQQMLAIQQMMAMQGAAPAGARPAGQ